MQGISASRAGENSESSVIWRSHRTGQTKVSSRESAQMIEMMTHSDVMYAYVQVRTLMACHRLAAVRGAARGGRIVLLGSVCFG